MLFYGDLFAHEIFKIVNHYTHKNRHNLRPETKVIINYLYLIEKTNLLFRFSYYLQWSHTLRLLGKISMSSLCMYDTGCFYDYFQRLSAENKLQESQCHTGLTKLSYCHIDSFDMLRGWMLICRARILILFFTLFMTFRFSDLHFVR